jgi:gas vesicle protein
MQYNDDDQRAKANNIGSTIGAALVGAAVGAAAAYLSSTDNRKKLQSKTHDVKKKASEWVDNASETAGNALHEAGEKVKNTKKKADTAMDDTFSTGSDTVF